MVANKEGSFMEGGEKISRTIDCNIAAGRTRNVFNYLENLLTEKQLLCSSRLFFNNVTTLGK